MKKEKTKKVVSKNVEQINRAPLQESLENYKKSENHDTQTNEKKTRKPVKAPADSKTWLQQYIADTSRSGAKLVTAMFAQPMGCSIEDASAAALMFAKERGSKWGNSAHVRSHLMGFLRSKGCKVEEIKEGIYRVSA